MIVDCLVVFLLIPIAIVGTIWGMANTQYHKHLRWDRQRRPYRKDKDGEAP